MLQAGRDMNLTAATVVNQGKDSLTQLSAGRDMTLSTVTTSAQDNITWDKIIVCRRASHRVRAARLPVTVMSR